MSVQEQQYIVGISTKWKNGLVGQAIAKKGEKDERIRSFYRRY